MFSILSKIFKTQFFYNIALKKLDESIILN